jgi:MFS family permease
MSLHSAVAPAFGYDPTQTADLPGGQTLAALASGVGHWALLATVLGVVVGAVLWAFGHYSHNYQQAYNGRKGVMVSGLAALLIGAAPTIVTFFLGQGQALH